MAVFPFFGFRGKMSKWLISSNSCFLFSLCVFRHSFFFSFFSSCKFSYESLKPPQKWTSAYPSPPTCQLGTDSSLWKRQSLYLNWKQHVFIICMTFNIRFVLGYWNFQAAQKCKKKIVSKPHWSETENTLLNIKLISLVLGKLLIQSYKNDKSPLPKFGGVNICNMVLGYIGYIDVWKRKEQILNLASLQPDLRHVLFCDHPVFCRICGPIPREVL